MTGLTIQFFKRLGGINSWKGSAPFFSSSSQLKSSLSRRLLDDVFAVTTGPQPPEEELICSAAIPIHHPPSSVFYIHLQMKIKGWCGALWKIAGRISVKRKDFILYPGRSSSLLPQNWRSLASFSSVYWKAKCPRNNRRCLGPAIQHLQVKNVSPMPSSHSIWAFWCSRDLPSVLWGKHRSREAVYKKSCNRYGTLASKWDTTGEYWTDKWQDLISF